MRAANDDARPLAESTCFLCERVGLPFVLASCWGADVTICSPRCLAEHGMALPITGGALALACI